jgi:SAM-dependent methyltransferase
MKQCLACGTLFQHHSWNCPNCHFEPVTKQGFVTFAPELADENTGYDITFFQGLARHEDGHFWFESRNALITWAVQRYFPKMKHFLEIGCGTGFVLRGINRVVPDLQLEGTDIYTEGLVFAQQRVPSAQFFQMDGQQIPFNQEFDVIGAFDVIEHIEGDETVLQQIAKALKPEGGLMLTVPQHRFLWSHIDELSYHKRRYSRHELVSKVQAAGFEVLAVTSFVSLLLPAMWGARLLKSKPTEDFDMYAEFKISRPLNFVLRQILRIENRLIRLGMSFPTGGSLFLIARLKPSA